MQTANFNLQINYNQETAICNMQTAIGRLQCANCNMQTVIYYCNMETGIYKLNIQTVLCKL